MGVKKGKRILFFFIFRFNFIRFSFKWVCVVEIISLGFIIGLVYNVDILKILKVGDIVLYLE